MALKLNRKGNLHFLALKQWVWLMETLEVRVRQGDAGLSFPLFHSHLCLAGLCSSAEARHLCGGHSQGYHQCCVLLTAYSFFALQGQ